MNRVVTVLSPDVIEPDPDNERDLESDADIADIAAAIKAGSDPDPVVVYTLDPERPGLPMAAHRYRLVSGHRRWHAAKLAGENVTAVVEDAPASDTERHLRRLTANEGRKDIDPIAKARTCRAILDEGDLNQVALARRLGMSQPALANLLRLLNLPQPVQDLIAGGKLAPGSGLAYLRLADVDIHRDWNGSPTGKLAAEWIAEKAQEAVKRQLSVRQCEEDAKGELRWQQDREREARRAQERAAQLAESGMTEQEAREAEWQKRFRERQRQDRLATARREVAARVIEEAIMPANAATDDHLRLAYLLLRVLIRQSAYSSETRTKLEGDIPAGGVDIHREHVIRRMSVLAAGVIAPEHSGERAQINLFYGQKLIDWVDAEWNLNERITAALEAAGLGPDANDVPEATEQAEPEMEAVNG